MTLNFSPEEIKVLNEFRSELGVEGVLEKLESAEDSFLIRWLRARDLNVKNAKVMLQNYLQWKDENEDYKAAHNNNWTPNQFVVDEFKYKFTGYDDGGRPVLWMPVARYDIKGILEKGMKADCFRYCYQMMDAILLEVGKQTQKCGVLQFVAIIDSAELTLRKITHVETIQCMLRFMKEFDAYYPELMHSCYVVNAPWLFSTVFNLVKPILSKHTLSKVNIFDSNEEHWKSVLVANIPASSIPIDYGGIGPPVLSIPSTTDAKGEDG